MISTMIWWYLPWVSLFNTHLPLISSFRGVSLDPLNIQGNDDDEEEEEEEDDPPAIKSDLSTSDYHSFVAPSDTSSFPMDCSMLIKKKMFDITDLLGSSSFDDHEHWFDKLQPISTSSPSLNVVDYLRAQALKYNQDTQDRSQWQIEENHLKYGK